ncbi:MAG: Eco57I restriction-modification methylase domain-containing protein [Deltaproteobacteria bacterium]|nr:Eco57I restriction-modification methylase domain-containing protein [Deltaproteobacteria bacterium]
MATPVSKERIQDALVAFANGNLRDNARQLFDTLGYRSEKRIDLSPNTAEAFLDQFDPEQKLNAKTALLDHWRSVDLLFQLTSDEITQIMQGRLAFRGGRVDDAIIESYLFFAVDLTSDQYTRTQFAGMTREINKLFAMPVMLLFRHGGRLTLAIINRRLGKRDESKDVLEKVTLIRDIMFADPLRAHIDILYDLSLPVLYEEFKFSNFVGLHRAWEKRLDTSLLNERFYHDIANWYFWVLQRDDDVIMPRDVKGEDQRSMFIIRLITRLIFCWFLQEKGLVPRDLFRRQDVAQMFKDFANDSSVYYKAILQNLFFATLNQEIPKRGFRSYNQSGGRSGNRGVTTLYRYRAAFRDPEAFVDLLKQVPFINGGLFDCLDQVFRTTEDKENVRLDDFSEEKENRLCLPNDIFFSEEHEVDLSEVYEDKRRRKEKVRGILEILSHYKFTVEENTPLEQEIALDPELLGKVFENLLASYNEDTKTTARKATGSFYTPREIVHYMVDEALIAYLVGQLNANGTQAELETKLREVFVASSSDFRNPFSQQETEALIAAIDHVKILDPACGSGAFPMGTLHRMVDLLAKLDPKNISWKKQQRARARQDRELAEHMQDAVIRESAQREADARIDDIERSFDTTLHELDFARKLYLIENCIYGVDIQPIACQIAKLRFFISLIVDQKVEPKAENFGVRPLPNLETKIVAADALVGLPVEGVLRSSEILEKEKELRLVRERHFSARTLQTKEKQRGEDRRLRNELAELFRRNGFSKEISHKLAAWDPYDQNAHSDFFDPEWMFGVTDGFEVVIGNPPYVRIQTLKQQNPKYAESLKKHYEAASKGNFDLYVVFVERGMQLLKNDGNLAYILPHKFFNAQYGEPLRGLLARGKHLAHIVHFGDQQVFPGTTNYVCLFFLRKIGVETLRFVKVDDLSEWLKTTQGSEAQIPAKKVTAAEWNFTVGSSAVVFEKLNQIPVKLGQLAERISQGIRTSANEVYVLDVVKKNGSFITAFSKQLDREVTVERKAVLLFLQGREIKPFSIQPSGKVVIRPYQIQDGSASLISEQELAKRFPKAHAYLVENKRYLSQREEGRFKGQHWYEYGRTQNIDLMLLPKILVPDIADHASFALDEGGNFAFTSGYGITLKRTTKQALEFILGLVNSHVLDFYWRQVSTPLRGGFYRYFTQFIEQLPIPSADETQQKIICHVVGYLLRFHRQQGDDLPDKFYDPLMSSYFEQLLNGLVYELFFPDELHAQKLFLFKYVGDAKLPVLSEIPETQHLTVLRETFERIYDLNHPIRSCLFALRALETVRIIEGEA